MAYTINYSGGTITLPVGGSNAIAGLTLMGQNYPNYGQNLNQNWVNIIQSSAGSTAPANPIKGQLWFNTTTNTLSYNITNGTDSWQSITANGGAANLTNVDAGNITVTGVYYGNGSGLTNITGANVTGQVNFAAVANSVAGANVTGQVNFASVANSVAGANVTGQVNFAAVANSVAGANVTGTVANATFATTADSTSGNATGISGTGRSMTTSDGSITGSWTLSGGAQLQATYADLAEYYSADDNITPGTVVEFGGTHELTVCDTDMSTKVAGVISTEPAYVMNKKIQSTHIACLALQGRVPCRVIGYVHKGDLFVSAGNGLARSESNPVYGSLIGKSLEDKNSADIGVIEVSVGR